MTLAEQCKIFFSSSLTREIPWSEELLLTLTVNRENCGIRFLEYVEVQIDLTFPRRGNLQMFSESPGRTRSQLLYPRAFDSIVGTKNFTKWTVSSLHYWGEDPIGDWKILIENSKPGRKTRNGNRLVLYSVEKAVQFKLIMPPTLFFQQF